MALMESTQELHGRIGRIEGLVEKLEASGDPAQRGAARELIQSLMEFHGAGFERILQIVSNSGETGPAIIQSLGSDELVGNLLVLYDLHPDDFETRVRRGLDKVRPLLRSHGARIELTSIAGHSVQLRITGSGSDDLEVAVREALFETAPDAVDLAIEVPQRSGHGSSFVPLTSLVNSNGSSVFVPATRS